MKIRCLKANKEVISSTTTTTYPAEWIGEVRDEVAALWIEAGTAVSLHQHDAPALTAEETAVLKAAAQQALAATGELSPKQVSAEALARMDKKELDALAKQGGIKTVGVRRAAIEAAILAKIQAAQQASA